MEDANSAQQEISRLREALAEKDTEVEVLRRLGQVIGSSKSIDELLNIVVELAVQVTKTDTCFIYLLDDTDSELVLRAAKGSAKNLVGKIRLKIGEGITGWVAKERKPVVLDREAFRDARYKALTGLEEDKYHSMLAVPLMVNDQLIGVINIRTNPPHKYTESQMRLIDHIAEQVANAIYSARMLKQMETQVSRLSTLSEVSRSIASGMYLDEILNLIVAMTAESMRFKIVTVMLLDDEKQELVICATQSSSHEYVKKPNLKLSESIAGKAVSEGKPITVLDVKNTPEYRYPDIARKEGLCSLIAVPLRLRDKIIGVMNCYTDKPHVFTPDEINVLTAIGSHAALAIENSKLVVKSAILREMHHRVKNNLQTIASLLRLQIHYGKGDPVEVVLQESINRILSIAAVHEILSHEELDAVSLKKVTQIILTATQQSLVSPDKHLETSVDGPDVLLPCAKATSVALILNELIQNAVEHGFKQINNGKIEVSIKESDRELYLEVANNGNLLSPDFNLRKDQNLGLQIVESLVRDDLHGSFTLANQNNRVVASVVFPK
jgi:two-component sensor histidine kinase/putative methionine-R-sulfoxide reductase with GAF domain